MGFLRGVRDGVLRRVRRVGVQAEDVELARAGGRHVAYLYQDLGTRLARGFGVLRGQLVEHRADRVTNLQGSYRPCRLHATARRLVRTELLAANPRAVSSALTRQRTQVFLDTPRVQFQGLSWLRCLAHALELVFSFGVLATRVRYGLREE